MPLKRQPLGGTTAAPVKGQMRRLIVQVAVAMLLACQPGRVPPRSSYGCFDLAWSQPSPPGLPPILELSPHPPGENWFVSHVERDSVHWADFSNREGVSVAAGVWICCTAGQPWFGLFHSPGWPADFEVAEWRGDKLFGRITYAGADESLEFMAKPMECPRSSAT